MTDCKGLGHSGCGLCDVCKPKPLKIGDRVPLPKEKLRVTPSRNADVGGKSLRGAFSNGRGRK